MYAEDKPKLLLIHNNEKKLAIALPANDDMDAFLVHTIAEILSLSFLKTGYLCEPVLLLRTL